MKTLAIVTIVILCIVTIIGSYGETSTCDGTKLCFFPDDYLKYIEYKSDGTPHLQIKYTHTGWQEGSKISVREDLVQLKPGFKWGEQYPNGTTKWVTEAEQYEAISYSYPYYTAYHYLMFPLNYLKEPYDEKLEFLKMDLRDSVYDFNGMQRKVIVGEDNERKIIIDKETGIVFSGTYGYYGYWDYELQDTNIITNGSKSIEENYQKSNNISENKILITPKIPEWVKMTMKWYIEGTISEDEIISALQFLIKEGIIEV